MTQPVKQKLVIAVSSRVIFDLTESNRVFEEQGVQAFARYQIEHENEILKPGTALPLVKRLLSLNNENQVVEVILLSKNDANTGLRVFNSIEHYSLDITRAAFTCGRPPYPYLEAFKTDLFLSADSADVRLALEHGYASATVLSGAVMDDADSNELRIAFDGDAVLFGDESERVYSERGLDAFKQNERDKWNIPLAPGPFKGFLDAVSRMQHSTPDRLRTALVTARNAPSHKRAILTLRSWGVQINEAFFLGGLDKTPLLNAFRPHIYFDDQNTYCMAASPSVPTGHVPYGVKNQ